MNEPEPVEDFEVLWLDVQRLLTDEGGDHTPITPVG
jgi:hypothetical protein